MNISPLQKIRLTYQPELPKALQDNITEIEVAYGKNREADSHQQELHNMFPHTYGMPEASFVNKKSAQTSAAAVPRGFYSKPETSRTLHVGVVLSGGQAPGGHNVIAGLFDALKTANSKSKLIGFLGGPSGILEDKTLELTASYIDQFRNTGGFDIIGSGRTKIETGEQFKTSAQVLEKYDISALVIIGGDDSNTNAALLAEYFKKEGQDITVIGVPKTIDGDLKTKDIEASFGFDTATKIYSELIGNIARDANSAKKYWHFIKLMGRSASHICLECALQSQPNIALISEEIASEKLTLKNIVDDIVQVIIKRSAQDENFGVVLVPEGLIEFIPEIKTLIEELNILLADKNADFNKINTSEERIKWVSKNLSPNSVSVFNSLPANIQAQLLMDRDPHGNVQVSRIETEKLLLEMVELKLKALKKENKFKGKFSAQNHFFGYEGRSAFPSNFDANYCYSLGYNAFLLIGCKLSGYISSIKNLARPISEWQAGGIPITALMNLEKRHGKLKPVIKKALVELEGKPFKTFTGKRNQWAITTSYLCPGAIQYYGPDEICNTTSITLQLEHS